MTQTTLPQGAIIITGAVGGMGKPAAVRFATRGQPLIMCDMSAERLDALASELKTRGAQVSTLAGDLAAPDFPERLLALVGDGEIAALIHTAGLSPTMADPERILEVNYFATERLLDAVAPRMAKGGCAVLISSSSGYMIPVAEMIAAVKAMVHGGGRDAVAPYLQSPQAAYPISKLGVMKLVAKESVRFGARGARIVSIAPGFIDTEMSRAEAQASEQMRAMMTRVPLQRMGSGDEIASVAEFLCSPAASYISGCDIKVDGGALGEMGL
jgi:NAD(P)-dependent dehydrogenase (short-subunit alcohol dehydrogenase family)